jgi:hypothetical protein
MKKVLFLILMIYIFNGCEKNDDSIIVGDKHGMIIKKYNKIIQCNPGFETVFINPFNNGVGYGKIDIPCNGDPLGGNFVSTPYLETEYKIGGSKVHDTIFYSKKVSIFYDSIYWKKMVKSIVIKTGCFRFYPDDSIRIKESNVVKVYKEGDMIFKNSDFITGRTYLRSSQGSINPYLGGNADTVVLESNHWDTDCHKLPTNGSFYFAIKMPEYYYNEQDGDEKIGWIKFTINADKKLELVESAIQK